MSSVVIEALSTSKKQSMLRRKQETRERPKRWWFCHHENRISKIMNSPNRSSVEPQFLHSTILILPVLLNAAARQVLYTLNFFFQQGNRNIESWGMVLKSLPTSHLRTQFHAFHTSAPLLVLRPSACARKILRPFLPSCRSPTPSCLVVPPLARSPVLSHALRRAFQ